MDVSSFCSGCNLYPVVSLGFCPPALPVASLLWKARHPLCEELLCGFRRWNASFDVAGKEQESWLALHRASDEFNRDRSRLFGSIVRNKRRAVRGTDCKDGKTYWQEYTCILLVRPVKSLCTDVPPDQQMALQRTKSHLEPWYEGQQTSARHRNSTGRGSPSTVQG